MQNGKRQARKKRKARNSESQDNTALKPAGEFEVAYQEAPPMPPEDKKIHKRRPLPQVPEAPAEDPNEAKH